MLKQKLLFCESFQLYVCLQGVCVWTTSKFTSMLKVASVSLLQLWLPPGTVSCRPGRAACIKWARTGRGHLRNSCSDLIEWWPGTLAKERPQWRYSGEFYVPDWLWRWMRLGSIEGPPRRGAVPWETHGLKGPVGHDVKCRPGCACHSRGPGKNQPRRTKRTGKWEAECAAHQGLKGEEVIRETGKRSQGVWKGGLWVGLVGLVSP